MLKDFGITALFGTLIIVGVLVIVGVSIMTNRASFGDVFPALSSWVGSIVTAYFVVKGIKESKKNGSGNNNNNEPKT